MRQIIHTFLLLALGFGGIFSNAEERSLEESLRDYAVEVFNRHGARGIEAGKISIINRGKNYAAVYSEDTDTFALLCYTALEVIEESGQITDGSAYCYRSRKTANLENVE